MNPIVIFDCDGVLVDSNRIKSDAFVEALDGYTPKSIERLIEYHRSNGGVTRYEKFRYFLNELVEFQGDVDAEKLRLAEKFGGICQAKLQDAELVPGIVHTLRECKNSGIEMFVITGGAEVEVIELLELKGVAGYFNAIYGNPVSKQDHARSLLRAGIVGPGSVYFGDSRLDYELSVELSANFVFVAGYTEWEDGLRFCQDRKNVTVINDFENLGINWLLPT